MTKRERRTLDGLLASFELARNQHIKATEGSPWNRAEEIEWSDRDRVMLNRGAARAYSAVLEVLRERLVRR